MKERQAGAIRRRDLMSGLGAVVGGSALLGPQAVWAGPTPTFAHGVASGDPLARQVMLWTRISGATESSARVFWELAQDADFRRVVRSGLLRTGAASDFTVKVDATGLTPDSRYFYRFTYNGQRSPVGRTRTLPEGAVDEVRLAVFSCSNYPAGYFHAYAHAAKRQDWHAVLHLGDYIYEYERTGYASADAESLGRAVMPASECVTLTDYRTRYALYHTDPDLQALRASCPMIAVWDDHEIANNSYLSGAANHTAATEGPYAKRRDAAVQAYHEWLPTRVPEPSVPQRLYRSFDFGDLLSLHMLETRLVARSKQLTHATYVSASGLDAQALEAAAMDPARQLMGPTQLNWLRERMTASTATWQVLGQQVLMNRMEMPAPILLGQISIGDYGALQARQAEAPDSLTAAERYLLAQPRVPENLDAWAGYGSEREAVLASARDLDKNLIALAGDTHNAWANDLVDDQGRAVGVEFGTPGVSSPGMEASRITDTPPQIASWMQANVPQLVWAETGHRGYLELNINREACRPTWHFVSTVKAREHSVSSSSPVEVRAGSGQRRLTRMT